MRFKIISVFLLTCNFGYAQLLVGLEGFRKHEYRNIQDPAGHLSSQYDPMQSGGLNIQYFIPDTRFVFHSGITLNMYSRAFNFLSLTTPITASRPAYSFPIRAGYILHDGEGSSFKKFRIQAIAGVTPTLMWLTYGGGSGTRVFNNNGIQDTLRHSHITNFFFEQDQRTRIITSLDAGMEITYRLGERFYLRYQYLISRGLGQVSRLDIEYEISSLGGPYQANITSRGSAQYHFIGISFMLKTGPKEYTRDELERIRNQLNY